MGIYEVILGIDHAARDTGRRITMRLRGQDAISAAIEAEELADATLEDPTEYTHAMKASPILELAASQKLPLPLAA